MNLVANAGQPYKGGCLCWVDTVFLALVPRSVQKSCNCPIEIKGVSLLCHASVLHILFLGKVTILVL